MLGDLKIFILQSAASIVTTVLPTQAGKNKILRISTS